MSDVYMVEGGEEEEETKGKYCYMIFEGKKMMIILKEVFLRSVFDRALKK